MSPIEPRREPLTTNCNGALLVMIVAIMGLPVVLFSCGFADSGTGANAGSLRWEVEYVAESGLRTAVKVDSVSWIPVFFPVEFGGGQEITGLYTIHFRNVTNSRLEVRYELRFQDRDGFVIDVFNPFNQPVRLSVGEVEEVNGEFRIRIQRAEDVELLHTLLVVLHIVRPG